MNRWLQRPYTFAWYLLGFTGTSYLATVVGTFLTLDESYRQSGSQLVAMYNPLGEISWLWMICMSWSIAPATFVAVVFRTTCRYTKLTNNRVTVGSLVAFCVVTIVVSLCLSGWMVHALQAD